MLTLSFRVVELSLRVVELSLRLLVVLFAGLRTCAGGVGERDRGRDDGLGDLAVVMLKNFIEPSVDEEKGWLAGEILDNSTHGFFGARRDEATILCCWTNRCGRPERLLGRLQQFAPGETHAGRRSCLRLDAVRALDAVRSREWVVICKLLVEVGSATNFRAQCSVQWWCYSVLICPCSIAFLWAGDC